MAKFAIQVGSTSQTIQLFVQNSATTLGGGLTGLTATGVTAYYNFSRQTPVAISLVTTTVATGVFATGAFIEISSANMPGWYRVDIPNASLASGQGNFVAMHFFGATNMAPVPVEIELTAVNNQSTTFGLSTTLPVNVLSWASAATATTNISLATLVNVSQLAGFTTATNQVAVATMAPANVIQWASFTAATTQVAIATAPVSANVSQWNSVAVASSPAVNVVQWSGFAAATTQTPVFAPPTNFSAQLITATGGVTTNTLSTTAITAMYQYAVDGSVTAEQSLRLANSANGAILSGATTTVIAIRDLANTKNRILASGDAQGNRLVVTLDLT